MEVLSQERTATKGDCECASGCMVVRVLTH